MKLFVVNCTAQTRQVYYRLDYSLDTNGNRVNGQNLPPKFLDIAPGVQVPSFGGNDLNLDQLQSLIQQLERGAGAVSMLDIKTAKAKGVVKLIYNIDQPVPRAICKDVQAHNMGRLSDIGEQRRQAFAINVDFGLRQISESLGNGDLETGFETEVQSVGKTDPEMTAPPISEKVRVVDKKGGGSQPPRDGRSRRAA